MSLLSTISIKQLPESKEFPFSLDLIQNLDEIRFEQPITFFVGENGSGKSTLLEAIAWAVGVPTIGSEDIDVDYTMVNAQKLGECLRLGWKQKTNRGFFSRSEDFFGFSKKLHQSILQLEQDSKEMETTIGAHGDLAKAQGLVNAEKQAFENRYGRDLTEISHGESFMKFFQNRLFQQGIYLLDEPEASLSPQSQLSLILLIQKAAVSRKSQFIIATHSPILLAMPNAQILLLENGKIKKVKLTETTHFQITKAFLENPEQYLQHLSNENT
jgi:predicted ATPase